MLKSINALRCALANLGTNAWNLVAATYWLLVGFGLKKDLAGWLDEGYQYVCTCQEDAANIIKELGGDADSGRSAYMLGTCSESGSVKKVDAKKKQMESRKKKADANKKASDDASRKRAEGEATKTLGPKYKDDSGKELTDGSWELEQEQDRAFAALTDAARKLEATAKPTAAQKTAVTNLQRTYEAQRSVKEGFVLTDIEAEVKKARTGDGIPALGKILESAGKAAKTASAKAEEFPFNKKLRYQKKAAETRVMLIGRALAKLAKSDDVSARQTDQIRTLERSAERQRIYDGMFTGALEMAKKGEDMELKETLDAAKAPAKNLQKGYLYTKYFDPTNKKLGTMKTSYEEAQL